MPELQAIADRLRSLNQTRADHRALLMQAEEYVRLRSESWRLRIDALQTRSLATLKTADRVERLSLDALARVRPD
jgi:5-methylthioribose kinase